MRAKFVTLIAIAFGAFGCSSDKGSKELSQEKDILADSETAALEGPESTSPEAATLDVNWNALPRLPKDRAFSKAYAAGAARRKVTPDHSIYMGGFGFCQSAPNLCRKSQGVHDDLWVDVVVIADTKSGEAVALGGIDAIGLLLYDHQLIQKGVQQAIYEKYGTYFDGTRIFLGASHSHAAPDTTGLWGLGFGEGRDEKYVEFLRNQVIEAVVEAYGNLADVSLFYGQDELSNDSGDKDTKDYRLLVLQGKGADGSVLFTLTRWSSHPTAYGSDNKGISADWVGTFRELMSKEINGLHIYLQGPIGDVYPNRPNECGLAQEVFPDGYKTPGLSPEAYMKVTCTGLTVVEAAKRALAKLTPLAETGIEHHYTLFKFHPDNGVLMLLANTTPLPIPQVDASDPNSLLDTAVGFARIGDLYFLSAPGEAFPTFAKAGEDRLRAKGAQQVFTLGLTYDWMGYLLTEQQYHDPDFAYHQTLCPGGELLSKYLAALDSIL